MPIRKQRAPRPGEIFAWLSSRRIFTRVTPEEGQRSGPQIRVAPCPACNHAKRGGSLTIGARTGLWNCRFCGKRGNWYGFTRLAGDPLPDPWEDPLPVDTSAYDKVRARMRRAVTANNHPDLLAAARARGLSDETLDLWRVSTAGPKILRWPLFAVLEDGRPMIANARLRKVIDRDEGEGSKDWFELRGGPTSLALGNHLLGRTPPRARRDPPAWLGDWLGEPAGDEPGLPQGPCRAVRRVLVVEGQWDAMAATELGIPNVLSAPNGSDSFDVSGLMRYVPERAEVWLAVDMDKAGDRAAEALFAQLGAERVRRLLLPFKDLDDWLMQHPQLTADEVFQTVREWAPADAEEESRAPTARPIVARTRAKTSGFVDLAAPIEPTAERKIVAELPWPRLTRRLEGGLRPSQTTGLLAPSGAGKTTIANQIVIHAAQLGTICGMVSLESAREVVIQKLRDQAAGWSGMDPEGLAELVGRIKLSPLEGKEVSWEETIEACEAAVDIGARLLVVDNWDYIAPSDSRGSTIKLRAYAALQRLCRRAGVHGIVIWQPGKVDRDAAVNSGQQKGLSQAFQDSDNYFTLNRCGLARRLDVEKARVDEADENLSTLWLRYDPKTKCLHEHVGQAPLDPSPGNVGVDRF